VPLCHNCSNRARHAAYPCIAEPIVSVDASCFVLGQAAHGLVFPDNLIASMYSACRSNTKNPPLIHPSAGLRLSLQTGDRLSSIGDRAKARWRTHGRDGGPFALSRMKSQQLMNIDVATPSPYVSMNRSPRINCDRRLTRPPVCV